MMSALADDLRRAGPPLVELEELDLDQVADIAIGMEDGPGGRFRARERVLLPLRAAFPLARSVAEEAAARRATRLVGTPPALRRRGDQGVMLDYDVHAHAPVRVVMITRPRRAA